MKGRGFTLIELMIALVIISVLVAVIYPSYSQYVLKAKRVDAQSSMQELSQKLAAYKISNGSFKNIDFSSLYGDSIPKSVRDNYTLTLTDINGVSLYKSTAETNTWMLTADPVNENAGTLTLDSKGKKCWYKEAYVCSNWDGN
ncbi:type IV pilin protein [Acinetobacter sp.]|uniref:type IV pilin protein n=1 Tax=Acinetobacter sp. TaxID=472 RepID=UPI00258D6D38|nr:type IV pilin protein [Acinetobacter sp.]